MNYFELYELPISFAIDQTVLRKKYYQLSKKYHPDFYNSTSTITEAENLAMSSLVNKAYTLLQNKQATIAYVLTILGHLTDDEKYQLSPDFLMEVMELNENMDEDSAAKISALKLELEGSVNPLLNQPDISLLTDVDFKAIKEYYYKIKYLDRLSERSKGVEWFD